jgi:hypothetical protein
MHHPVHLIRHTHKKLPATGKVACQTRKHHHQEPNRPHDPLPDGRQRYTASAYAPLRKCDPVLQGALVEGVGGELGQNGVHAVLHLQPNGPHTQHNLHQDHNKEHTRKQTHTHAHKQASSRTHVQWGCKALLTELLAGHDNMNVLGRV